MSTITSNKINELKQRLSNELTPFSAFQIARHFILWVVISLICIIGGVFYFGLRSDMRLLIDSLAFLTLAFLGIGAMGALGYMMVLSGLPGRESDVRKFLWVLVGLAVIGTGVGILAIMHQPSIFPIPVGWVCTEIVGIVMVIPLVLGTLIVKKLAPTSLRNSAILTVLAASICGLLAVSLVCAQQAAHILVWHIFPIALTVGITAVLFRR